MQEKGREVIVVSQMKTRAHPEWSRNDRHIRKKNRNKQLLRYTMLFAAVFLFLGIGGTFVLRNPDKAHAVMSHVNAGFEYDETLGRLQFVSNLLPESAMVFLENDLDANSIPAAAIPSGAQMLHAWSQEEPWFEYSCVGEISACQDGQIMTIVENRDNEYTIRIAHQNGYESLYSGLHAVQVKEFDKVSKGQQIGTATGFTAFEWRKDGLSVLPARMLPESRRNEI